MKHLLIVTTLIEAGAGLALIISPSASASLLLGAPLDAYASVTLSRVAGAALCALGLAAWLAHYDEHSRAARGLVSGLLLYNFATAIILGVAGKSLLPFGIALQTAVIVHASMSAWCIKCLSGK
jgi:hypothetical protein